jgi:hypothetical protein
MEPTPAIELNPARWVDDYADYLYRYRHGPGASARGGARPGAGDVPGRPEGERPVTRAGPPSAPGSPASSRTRSSTSTGAASREPLLGDLLDRHEEEDFDPEDGHWRFPHEGNPREWQEEQIARMDRPEFWKRFTACADRLPEQMRRVFVLREVDGWEGDAICRELQITSQNYWTIMHRARAALRRCLEATWFAVSK